MPRPFIPVAFAVLFALPSTFAQDWEDPTEESQKVSPSDGAAETWFGWSTAMQGNTTFISAYYDSETEDKAGAVYVFDFDDVTGDWIEGQKIVASDAEEDDRFGRSVDVSDDVLVVAVPWDNEEGSNSGSLYVFRYDADLEEWIEEQVLTTSDASVAGYFGNTACVSGEVILGCENLHNGDNGDASGAAYVFRYEADDEEWVEEQKLTASDGESGDQFAISAALDGDLAVVGAQYHDEGEEDAGAAYIFRYESDTEEWVEEQKLTASDAVESDLLGSRVAVAGDVVFVSSQGNDGGAVFGGAVYVFRHDADDEEWVEEQKLVSSDIEMADWFGHSLGAEQDAVVIGAIFDAVDGDITGAAYVFEYQEADDPVDSAWIETAKLLPSDRMIAAYIGWSVALWDDRAVVGAIWDQDNGEESGSAYFFQLPGFFLRGDADNSGSVSALVDTLYLLQWAFSDGDDPPCMDAADMDDSGTVSALVDALALLQWAFTSGDDLPDPGREDCGRDPTADDLDCTEQSEVCS